MNNKFSDLFLHTQRRQGRINNTLPARFGVLENTQDHIYDDVWGGTNTGTQSTGMNSYFDYFYSGQDIICVVDGTEQDSQFRVLPMMQIGWSIVQQKMPVFGYASYTHDAVLRGNRIVQGSFVIATRYPNYIRDLLSTAAATRAHNDASYSYYKNLTEDDANIEKYWQRNLDPSLQSSIKNVYSAHPPFSFVIIYGVQNVSVNNFSASAGVSDLYLRYREDNPWMTDINERLIESDLVNQSNRVILDACEIQSMETGYGSDGAVITETYSFFGRDIITPETVI